MEIIKHGNAIREYSCKCGCIFIAFNTERQIERDYFTHKMRYYVSCPECGRTIKDSYTDWRD